MSGYDGPVLAGQVWASTRKGDLGRNVTVVRTDSGYVRVQRDLRLAWLLETTLRSRYRLVKDAP